MATLTISLAGSSVVNGSKSWTVSDADVQALIDYNATKYSGGSRGETVPPLTPAQALLAWAQGFVRQSAAEVHADKIRKAQVAAAGAVTAPQFT